MDFEVIQNERNNPQLWNQRVEYHPYKRFEWLEIIEKSYSLKPYFFAVEKDKNYALIGCFKTRKGFISLPFLSYSGVVASDEALRQNLEEIFHKMTGDVFDSRDMLPLVKEEGWVNSILHVENVEAYLKTLSSNMRNQIKRCQKLDLTSCVSKNVDDFYEIYARNVHRLGTPVHKKAFFENILHHIPESFVFSLQDAGRPVASMLILYDDKCYYDFAAATAEEYSRNYANYLMYWRVIELMLKEGRHYLDMGRSTFGSGTHQFKRKFRPNDYSIQSSFTYASNSLSSISRLWTFIPYRMSLGVGPILRRYLP